MRGKKLFLVVLVGLVAVVLSGCAALDRVLYEQRVTEQPGQVTRTNTVLVTNAVSGVVTPVVTFEYAPPVLVTNLVPRTGVETLIQGGGALPFPFAGTIAVLLAWLYSLYASIRNRKVAAGIVQSVERGREWLQTTPEGQRVDEQFRKILEEHQDSAGIVGEVQKLLARYVKK